MTPIVQTVTGAEGNCEAACIASILEVPLRSIPNVGWMPDGFARMNWWLRRRGLVMTCFGWDEEFVRTHYPDVFLIIGGNSPRGPRGHAVIFRGTELAHDPHPDGGGIVGAPSDFGTLGVFDVGAFDRWKSEARKAGA